MWRDVPRGDVTRTEEVAEALIELLDVRQHAHAHHRAHACDQRPNSSASGLLPYIGTQVSEAVANRCGRQEDARSDET